MRWPTLLAACLFASVSAASLPAQAQGTGASPEAAPSSRSRSARPKREPTAGQMAARERMRKCAGEWKEAKAKNATAGQKWPQFWSACNKRMKGNAA